MDSRDVIRKLETAGWRRVGQTGSHVQFKHPERPGRRYGASPEKGRPCWHIAQRRETVGHEVEVNSVRNYIGLIHKDPDSDFGVSFPDFPGAVTAGKSLDEARAMAEESLAFHIEGIVEDGEAIPEPSSLEDVMADPKMQAQSLFWLAFRRRPRRLSA